MNPLLIREETRADRTAVETVVAAAFGRPDEAHLVARLRDDGHAVLSLVAEDALAGVLGHVLFTRLVIETARGPAPLGATALAPVSVMPDRQRHGIGSALIRDGLARLRAAGEDICFVVGEPDYYARFGFDGVLAARFECVYAGPFFMALALRPLDATRLGGTLTYPAPFAAIG
jgi:putative acetyltransferase